MSLHDRLLEEAIGILSREGGTALTVRRVAAAAGCSTIGVYTYFDGKAGLIDAIVKDGFEALDGAVSVADTLTGGVARLHAGAHLYRDWALANGTRYRVMFDAYIPDAALGPDAATRGGASFAAHRARVAYAVERGELRGPDGVVTLDDLAFHIWAGLHGHVLLHLLRGISADDPVTRAEFDRAVGWLLLGLTSRSG